MRITINAGFAVMLLIVMIWTFHTVFVTQSVLDRVETLESEIAQRSGAISLLKAEWSYLNGDKRLAMLVDAFKDDLALIEITPRNLRRLSDIPLRKEEPPETVPASSARSELEAFP